MKRARSILLATAARYLMPLMLIFSVFLLLRGHNEIGGGFVGGLVAASALMLYGIALSPAALRTLLPVEPRLLVGLGLLAALTSGLLPVLAGLLAGPLLDLSAQAAAQLANPSLYIQAVLGGAP